MADANPPPSQPQPQAPAQPEPSAPSTLSATKDMVVDTVKNQVGSLVETARNNTMYIVAVILVTAASAFALAYFLYWMINRFTISKKMTYVSETKVPIVGNVMTKVNGVASPVSANGKRFTMCFWIYVHDFDKYRGSMRHVLHVGDEDTLTSSPIVYFGPDDNKLYVAFNTNKPDPAKPVVGTNGATAFTVVEYLVNNYGIVIDYIPSQRWVHVAIVVNEDSAGGSITAFVDADLVKVVTTGSSNKPGTSLKLYDLNISKSGVLVVGGSTSDSVGPGFSGLVAGVRLYNYDMNVNDVYYVYKEGPIDNILSKLGLPPYGVRSPIYKL